MTNKPLVSIVTITYKHEKYILDTIQGVLSQKTNFDIEHVVADDNSPDKTEKVVKGFLAENSKSHIVKYTRHKENKGMHFNFIWALEQCQGKYIALCEGDDYWTDPLKLQKQVDFLEENKDYSICFHKVNLIHPDHSITEDNITKVPENYESIEDLAEKGNYIHTPSIMFRRKELIFPEEMKLSPIGDFFLYMLLAKNGKVGFIKEKMAVYRVGSGIWSDKSRYERNLKTNYCFALLIKTNLFTEKVNQILINRIEIFLKKFGNELESKDLLLLSLNENLTNKIFQSLLDLYESEKMKTKKSTMFQLKKCVKRVLK